jgi:dihydroxyacetone kinase
VPVLNGLGSVKSEELFVVFSTVADLLEARGATLVDPQVGEFCTSFDMAGVSLTLLWLDDELETLWAAPTDTPAFRSGALDRGALVDVTATAAEEAQEEVGEASGESRAGAAVAARALDAVREVIDANADELGRLDSIAGDGDHGIGMQRGARAAATEAADVLTRGAGARTLLARAGDAWSDRAGGTSGALWGVILRSLGDALGDDRAVGAADVSAGATAASDAVRGYGKASPGDKTMVDAVVPFVEALAERVSAGDDLPSAWSAAATAARTAADATSELMPGLGRARSHGEKSLGTPDPGAVSFALIVEAVAPLLTTTIEEDS